jgi:hypothetical protein
LISAPGTGQTIHDLDIKFQFRYMTYQYDHEMRNFKAIRYYFSKPFTQIHDAANGIDDEERQKALHKYGPCTMQIKVGKWYIVLIQEVVNLYYIFQVFSIAVWLCNEYYRSCGIIGKFWFKNKLFCSSLPACSRCFVRTQRFDVK